MTSAPSDPPTGPTLVYDGQCPFCSAYARGLRINPAAGPLALVDARGENPLIAEIRERGLDLDQGMVLSLDGRLHHGAECLTQLALLSSGATPASRLNRLLFRRASRSRALYPVLVCGRNAVLRLLGRSRISSEK